MYYNNGVSDRWYRKPLFLTAGGLATLLLLSLVFPPLIAFQEAFLQYLHMVTIPLLLGLLAGGMVDVFVPRRYISQCLAHGGRGVIPRAVGLGFLASACSHGCLALAIALYRKGASVPATIAFLMASPWANLSMTLLLFGFFGVKAFLIVGVALVIAVLTGWSYQWLDRREWIERNPHTLADDPTFSIKADLRQRWRATTFSTASFWRQRGREVLQGAWTLADMVLWWVLLGMGIAAFIVAYVPTTVFQRYLGPNALGLLATLGAATVVEICSEGSAPLAFELYRQTQALGNATTYLMAGVATDYTELGLVWTNIGRRAALWLPAVAIPQILLFGFLLNLL